MSKFNGSASGSANLADLLALIAKPPHRRGPETLFMHPEALAAVMRNVAAEGKPDIFGGISPLLGIPVYSSPFMPKHPKKWLFPRDPFVDYEESDEAWARPVNYGREVDDTTKLVGYAIRMPQF